MERENVIAALECCLPFGGGSRCGKCPYFPQPRCDALMLADVLALLQAQQPRPLSREEFAALPAGVGWEESWMEPDEESGESFALERLAWADGHAVSVSGMAEVGRMVEMYGERYGVRVWIGDRAPTEAERQAWPWRPGEGQEDA